MVWWIILGAEVVLLILCIVGAKWWIENKSTPEGEVPVGRNETMIFGEDSKETIQKMIDLAKELFTSGKLLEDGEGFSTQVTTKNNSVTEVVVKTAKTKVIYTGGSDENLSVENIVRTKSEATTYITLMSWATISLIPWMTALFVMTAYMFYSVFTA